MPTNNFGVCPTGCGTELLLPVLDADQNCIAYDDLLSQINDLWIKPNGATGTPFTDWATGTVTANPTVIDNTDILNANTKWLVGEGSIPAADKTIKNYPKSRKKTTKRVYTLSYIVKNLSDAQYAFLRSMQCGDTDFTFWYATEQHVYGSEAGLSPESVDCDFVYGGGNEDVVEATVIITFVAKTDPDRVNNPY